MPCAPWPLELTLAQPRGYRRVTLQTAYSTLCALGVAEQVAYHDPREYRNLRSGRIPPCSKTCWAKRWPKTRT